MPRSPPPLISRSSPSSPYSTQTTPTRHSQRLASRKSAPSAPTPAPFTDSFRDPGSAIGEGSTTLPPSSRRMRHGTRGGTLSDPTFEPASTATSIRKNVLKTVGRIRASEPSSSTTRFTSPHPPLSAASHRRDLGTPRTQPRSGPTAGPSDIRPSRSPPSPSFDSPALTLLERFDLSMATSDATGLLPTPSASSASGPILDGAPGTRYDGLGRMDPTHSPSGRRKRRGDEPSTTTPIMTRWAEEISTIAKCGVCWQFMGTNAFVLECGHSFCPFCLRRCFESKIRRDLGPLCPHTYVRLHKEDECQTIPQSSSEKSVLIECLHEHGLRAEVVFRYSCPTCREPVTVAPRPNVTLSQILATAAQAFKGSFKFEQLEPTMALSNAQKPFDGLFLTASELADAHLRSYL